MNNFSFPLKKLWFAHIFILVLSNYAVQIPLTIFGIHTTLGTFTYPFIFLSTDLTVRIYGQNKARKIVFLATFPGLVLSYIVGTVFEHGYFQGISNLTTFSMFVFRITFASLSAYLVGQLADILIFQRLRELKTWWPAPTASSVFGNLLDTYTFFAIAFIGTSDPFMAQNWFEIASVDYVVKILTNIILFLPIYGLLLNILIRKLMPNKQ
ncbi:MAG: 7-cyano-7-deazaguanine/7-aminomethyl-7-deazaguanine transporter [Succinivibrio sp.]